MNNNQFLELGYQLLLNLGIQNIEFKFCNNHNRYELSWYFNNQGIIAYGNTKVETIEHFYELYQNLVSPA